MEVRNTDGRLNSDEAHSNHSRAVEQLHPAWKNLIVLCEKIGFGELERLKIQHGLPVAADTVLKKIRFGPP